MRWFLISGFIAGFFFGWALHADEAQAGQRLGSAIGVAILLTFIGWLVARKGGYRWAAASMAVFASLAWIGS
jgi:hypothetical protein